MVALLIAAMLMMAPLPIVPTVDPVEAPGQATKTTTSSALSTLEEVNKKAGELQEQAQAMDGDLTSYNKNVKSPNEDVMAVSQDYGTSQSKLSGDFDVKDPLSVMKALEKLFVKYPCTEQRCREIYNENRYQFYENNVVEIYALTNTVDKLIEERLTPLLDEINVQGVSDQDQNENIRNNLMVRQALVQILTIIHELSAAELQLEMAKEIKFMNPVEEGDELFKTSMNEKPVTNFASINESEEVSFAFMESIRKGFAKFDEKAVIEEEKKIEKEVELKKYDRTIEELRTVHKEEVQLNKENQLKDLNIEYRLPEEKEIPSQNLTSKKKTVKKKKSIKKEESLENKENPLGENSIFAFSKKADNKHPISLIADKLEDLRDIEPLRKEMKDLMVVQNKLNEIYDYPPRLDRYREIRKQHENILTALKNTENNILAYMDRNFNGAGRAVWLGGKTPSAVNDYEGRGGVSAKAMALFDAQKAILANENPESVYEVPAMTQEDLEAKDADYAEENKIENMDDLKKFSTNNVELLEDEDLEAMEEDNRKTQLIGWNTGRFLMQDLFKRPDNYSIPSIAKQRVWNDNKSFYDAYIYAKLEAMKKFINALPIDPILKNTYVSYVNTQKRAYDDLSEDKYYPENHQMVIDVIDGVLKRITNNAKSKITAEINNQAKFKSDAEAAISSQNAESDAKVKEEEDKANSSISDENANATTLIAQENANKEDTIKILEAQKAAAEDDDVKAEIDAKIAKAKADAEEAIKNIEQTRDAAIVVINDEKDEAVAVIEKDRADKIGEIEGERDTNVAASEQKQAQYEKELSYFNNTQELPDTDYYISSNGAISDFNSPAVQPKIELNLRQILFFDDVDYNNINQNDKDELEPMTAEKFLAYKYGDIENPGDGTDSYIPEIWYLMLKMKKGDYNFGNFNEMIERGTTKASIVNGKVVEAKNDAIEETIQMIAKAEEAGECNQKYDYENSDENEYSELGLFISGYALEKWGDIIAADPDECKEECIEENYKYAFTRNGIGDFLDIRSTEIGFNAAVKKANADIDDINENFRDLLKLAGYTAPKDFDVMNYKKKSEKEFEYTDLELARRKLTEYRDKLLSKTQGSYSTLSSKSSGNKMLKERLSPIGKLIKVIKADKKAVLRVTESSARIPDIEEQIKTAEADLAMTDEYNEEANANFKDEKISVFCPVY